MAIHRWTDTPAMPPGPDSLPHPPVLLQWLSECRDTWILIEADRMMDKHCAEIDRWMPTGCQSQTHRQISMVKKLDTQTDRHSPSRLDSSCTRPLRQVSRTRPMLVAQRPMAWIVAATKSLSMLRI